jgi:pantothenate kinase
MGLAATTVASSFGKLVQPGRREAAMQAPQHLAKAVLLMVTNNIGSIAMLHARAAGVAHIMFTGSFLHDNKLAMRLLTVAMNFWSKGNIKAVFLRHEGHAGAVGALLSTLELSNPIDALLLNSK